MHTNDDKLLFKEEVFRVVGCAIEVLNTLGHGLVEKLYENVAGGRVSFARNPFSAATFVLMSSTRASRLVCSFRI
jgi:PD-(D/E)XK nuclease superfamily